MPQLIPGQPFPPISVPRVGGGRVDNSLFDAPSMTVLNVYRGLHCPRCKAQLADFAERQEEMAAAGVEIVSVSTDSRERAEQAVSEWALGGMAVGCEMTVAQARDLGVYISKSIRETEPVHFAEAALFFIQPNGVLWGAAINSFPFLRPDAEMILDAVSAARDRDYPPRGDAAA